MPSFFRYRDKVTKKEFKLWAGIDFTDVGMAQRWFEQYYRNAEFIEFAPWSDLAHAGTYFPVPAQNVRFDVLRPQLAPAPRRNSVLISHRIIQKLIHKEPNHG